MAQTIPTAHAAGDTFTATLADSRHPASDGWGALLVLIGDAARYTVSAAASGDEHVATATAATTASWRPGAYTVQVIYTLSTQRASYSLATLRIAPNPAAPGTLAAQLKGPAAQAYSDLLIAYRADLAAGRWTVQEYVIAGRRMTFRTLPELLTALDRAKRDADAEAQAEAIAQGVSPRRRFVVRM